MYLAPVALTRKESITKRTDTLLAHPARACNQSFLCVSRLKGKRLSPPGNAEPRRDEGVKLYLSAGADDAQELREGGDPGVVGPSLVLRTSNGGTALGALRLLHGSTAITDHIWMPCTVAGTSAV